MESIQSRTSASRTAHSLIEMLVVLIIVAVLIAIVVPAVQRARESARMAQCIHNQGQLAKAVHLHVSDEPYGRFPGYRTFAADGTTVIGWAPQVFEHLGRSDLPEDPTQATYIEVLVCPSNQGPKDTPRLNYVVNGGRAGIDSPADGIFFDHAKEERVYITKDDFGDGLTNTILLAENLDATKWNETDESSQCILWPLVEGSEINRGEGSRPSSHHPGGFVAAYADGSVKFLNEVDFNDDAAIYSAGSFYTALLTPGGDDAPETEIVGVDPCEPVDQEQINDALNWIVRHQFDDGHWSFVHTNSHTDCDCTENGTSTDTPIAATAFAMLPLLGGGSNPVSGPFREEVCRGVEYLLANQDPTTGSLYEPSGLPTGNMYSHLIAHLALAEAYVLEQEARQGGCSTSGCSINPSDLLAAIEKATEFTIAAQIPYVDDSTWYNKGGWGYGVGTSISYGLMGNSSHAKWAIAALKTSEKCGVSVPSEVYERTRIFLSTLRDSEVMDQGEAVGTLYAYGRTHYPNATFGLPSKRATVLAMLCHVYMGTPTDHAAVQTFVDTIQPSTLSEVWMPTYFNMHATQLMYLVGGDKWETWNTDMQNLILPGQLPESAGHAAGSWNSTNPNATASDTQIGGRLFTTCANALCLEAYFAGLKLGR